MTGREVLCEIAVQQGLWSSADALRRYLDWFFKGVTLHGKRVLDIGGGNGLLSCYAGVQGARDVVCLEPEAAGGLEGMKAQFAELTRQLGLCDVNFLPLTLQEFEADPGTFDILLLHNSVNHLDEYACVNLLREHRAAETYRMLFEKMATLGSSRAEVILADCTPYNVFPALNLKHPLSTSIEWHKHQTPEVWSGLLHSCGFREPRIGWSSYNRLGAVGWLLFANRLGAFLLTGHFRLHMKKEDGSRS